MEKFKDAHELNPDTPDYEQKVLQRFEAFQKLPIVTKAITELAVERNSELLGRTFTPEELASVGTELEARITQDEDFQFLDILSEQIRNTKDKPAEIMRLQLNLDSLGNRETLRHKAMSVNFAIARKEQNIRRVEGSHEGMALAKEGVAAVQGLEKGLDSAENGFFREAEAIVKNYRQAFNQLESSAKKLAAAQKKFPEPGTIYPPDLSGLNQELGHMERQKKDPNRYLEVIAGSRFCLKLDDAKNEIRSQSEAKVGELRKVQRKKREAQNYPNLPEAISEFGSIRVEVSSINIDMSWDEQAEELQNDIRQVAGIRQGLGYLKSDPGNRVMRRTVEEAVGDFQTVSGRNLASQLKFGLVELSQIQNRLERSPASDDDIRTAVDHSAKNFMRRLISRDPAKKLKKEAQRNVEDVERLEHQKDEILSGIDSIDDAELALEREKNNFESAKKALSLSLKTLDSLFKKAGAAAKAEINTHLASEDPMEIIKAKGKIDRLIKAREAAPELYGAMDDDDDDRDTSFYGNQNLKGLEQNYLDHLMVKVEGAIRRKLEAVSAQEIDPDSLARHLKQFEVGLGSLANTREYQQVRLQAFRNLASRNSIFPASKKLVLGQMLAEAQEAGFIRGGVFDLKGFAGEAPQAAA